MPGIYRQTAETTGMYSPFRKHLYRAQQIVPSRNCASQKIIPSHSTLKPYEFPKKCLDNGSPTELMRESNVPHTRRESVENLYSHFNHQYSPHLEPLTRPYTPPEKRYSPNFGFRLPERKLNGGGRQRPQSSYVYENIHAQDEFCANRECNMNRIKSERNLYNAPNVKVKSFPTPEFNRLYIQDNLK